ncbi:MAG: hypothetical protein JOY60_08180 [Burkholderiaceae bacterium]|nr:hypothetical protein [Burkholderiaceae bacterium]
MQAAQYQARANVLTRGKHLLAILALAVTGCATNVPPSEVKSNAKLSPTTAITQDLTRLPRPKVRIPVAVYAFRDETGQYKPSPDSAYSTLVSQGAATMLIKALWDSGWYVPVEREGLQNLLTERRVIRAAESSTEKGKPLYNLPNMMPASMIIEGGVIAYESNVRSGGKGANYLGIGASTQYRVDQVTVSLRSVDVRYGQILNAVSVTKTIYSYQLNASIYAYTSYQALLQAETGYATNEPGQLAVREAIEAAVIHLTVNGIRDHNVELEDNSQWFSPVIQAYLGDEVTNLSGEPVDETAQIPMRPVVAARETVVPLPFLDDPRQAGGAARAAAAATTASQARPGTQAPAGAAASPPAAPPAAATPASPPPQDRAAPPASSTSAAPAASLPAKAASAKATAAPANAPANAPASAPASAPTKAPAIAAVAASAPAAAAPSASSASPAAKAVTAPANAPSTPTPAPTAPAPDTTAAAARPAAPTASAAPPAAAASAVQNKPKADIFDLYWNRK